MNTAIYKYTFDLTGRDIKEVRMPLGANVLTVQEQRGELCLWAMVAVDQPPHYAAEETRRFLVVGTGHRMPERPVRYLGTIQMMSGALVLHVFELDKERT